MSFQSKGIFCSLLLVMSSPVAQTAPGPSPNRVSWVALFDGHTLEGWTPEQGARWHVSGASIVGDAGEDGWLRSSRQFKNFQLKIEYRNSIKGNSGVFLRATKESNLSDPSNPAGSYELQINNEDEKWPAGSIENFIQRLVPVNPVPNQWHAYDVEVQHEHIVATLDGTRVLDGHDAKFKTGYIGLQHHRGNRIEFRNIKIRLLTD